MATIKPIQNLEGMRMQIKVTGAFRMRIRIGLWIMRMAAFVMGCGFTVENEEKK